MKVLQINAVYGMSSTGRTVAEIDEALKKQGILSWAEIIAIIVISIPKLF